MTKIDLYRNIGYLSYAVATSKNNISKDSIRLMKNELIKIWYSVEHPMTAEDDTDSYIQIELIFNWLLSHGMSSKYALKNFNEFVIKNSSLMSEDLKNSILLYAKKLAQRIYPTESQLPIIETIQQWLSAPSDLLVKK